MRNYCVNEDLEAKLLINYYKWKSSVKIWLNWESSLSVRTVKTLVLSFLIFAHTEIAHNPRLAPK